MEGQKAVARGKAQPPLVRCNLCVAALTKVQTARRSGVSFTADALECIVIVILINSHRNSKAERLKFLMLIKFLFDAYQFCLDPLSTF